MHYTTAHSTNQTQTPQDKMSGLTPALSYGMHDCQRHITTVAEDGKSTFIKTSGEPQYRDRGGYSVTWNYVTDGFPCVMDGDQDAVAFLTDSATSEQSWVHTGNRIVNNGMTFGMANFGPGVETSMHRTISLDFICIVEGELELELDSGEIRHLKAGVSVDSKLSMNGLCAHCCVFWGV